MSVFESSHDSGVNSCENEWIHHTNYICKIQLLHYLNYNRLLIKLNAITHPCLPHPININSSVASIESSKKGTKSIEQQKSFTRTDPLKVMYKLIQGGGASPKNLNLFIIETFS